MYRDGFVGDQGGEIRKGQGKLQKLRKNTTKILNSFIMQGWSCSKLRDVQGKNRFESMFLLLSNSFEYS